ncbi:MULTISPECIES: phosphatase PAP2 family protein [Paraburkholderia]|uniref:phosphatase PAP2 family protein n=1 Tax=Paraburkholderia TaxID=1822464 RepID=UPI002256EA2C|nr:MULTISPECIES: phosphatase PAP2 family protein [Paraburkholderia]MCX4162417.1 phosphatase PAP2 family protein [Paraburkholderia megapolitana]MDN7157912.1 phosphatase PAP2 family protein [Paraburkholderia sp. CHISQ3]MDQ6494959.1 phosphatase PAP2 family protein [Paraburkholderia megapolitana]
MMNLRRLTGRPDYRQALVALLGMLVGLSIFFALERAIVPRYSFVTPVDSYIPFIPVSWYVYVLFFPFVVALSAYAPASDFNAFKSATLLAFAIGIVSFLMFPEFIPRPDTALIENAFLRQRLSRMWRLDLPSNGFPSLHVAVTCLACLMLRSSRHWWLVALAGALICLSTLTLKQHTVADVAGGVLLSAVCSFLAHKHKRQNVGASREIA